MVMMTISGRCSSVGLSVIYPDVDADSSVRFPMHVARDDMYRYQSAAVFGLVSPVWLSQYELIDDKT